MTKVTYIHGVPQNEWADRGKEVRKRPYINYGAMTVGETRLSLILEQTKILRAFYPESKELAEAENLLYSALGNGLHALRYLPGNNVPWARKAIQRAIPLTKPAAGHVAGRRSLETGVRGLIPFEDCQQYMREENDPYAQYDSISYHDTTESLACQERNKEVGLLNQHLEPSSHHLLYEYLKNPNTAPGIVAAKTVSHRNAVSGLSSLMDFNRDNMALWLRNGIMRNNATNGTQPFQPEKTIDILRTESPGYNPAQAGTSVSGPFLVALPIILKAIAAAIGATVALVSSLKAAKAQQLRNTAQGIGSLTFGPQADDWDGPGGNGGNGGNGEDGGNGGNGLLGDNGSNTPLLLLGAGAVLLLMNSK